MPEDQAPPVVAVVVTSDPGPWLEDCLTGLLGQDYTSLSILVIDAASDEPLAERVASVAPDIYLHRLTENAGFGPSANAVSGLVDGATYFLFCHDDVVMESDAVRRLVEEAFRSNAAIAGPKLVDFDEPDRILQLGLGVDRYGAPVRRVARLEFDQAQHDEAREVFAVPGGATLLRTDLFDALGGFDKHISMFGEDIDFCWRARLVGARIVIVPNAIVRHLEATAARKRPLPESRALQWRHELRAVLKNYGQPRRAIVLAQLMILSIAEMIYFAAIGKRRRSKEVIEAWRWNFAPAQELKAARQAVSESRSVSDHAISQYFSSRTSRIGRFVISLFQDTTIRLERRRDPFTSNNERPKPHREARPRAVTAIAIITALVLVFGTRSLLSGKFPLIGDFLPLPSPTHLLANFFGGYTNAGLQRSGPESPAAFFLGIVGIICFGAMGFVFKAGLVALVVAGAFGVARLVRPFGSHAARLGAAVTYLFLPLAWNDLSKGDLAALIAYGGVPWVLLRLFRATGAAPFVTGDRVAIRSARTLRECLWLGIIVAGLCSFVPGMFLLVGFLALALYVACLLGGDRAAGVRALAVGFGSVVVAFALCFPWSLTFIQPGVRWSSVIGAAASPSGSPSIAQLLRFQTGALGAGLLGWAFLAASLFVIAVGRRERFTWAVRIWVIALLSVALTWVVSEGWLGAGDLLSVWLAPFGALVAVLVGFGVATVFSDLRRVHFGWRHVAAAVFAVISTAGLLPVLGASATGHFSVPSTGYDAVLSFTNATGNNTNGERVLWLGDPRTLPLPSWQISPGFAFGVSEGGLPDMSRFWASADPGVGASLQRNVLSAQAGLTVRLGNLISRAGVRYIIVPTAIAPVLPGEQGAAPEPPPQALLAGLSAQTDLRELPSEGGAFVFANTAWHAGKNVPSGVKRSKGFPSVLRVIAVIVEVAIWFLGLLYVVSRRRRSRARHARRSARNEHGLSNDIAVVSPIEVPTLVSNDAGQSS